MIGEILVDVLKDSPTAKIRIDTPFIVWALHKRYGLEVPAFEVRSPFRREAESLGFVKDAERDSRGVCQYVRESPRFIVCPTHGVRATLGMVAEGDALSFRADHEGYSCRVDGAPFDNLRRIRPRLDELLQK
jgi:hypothetical protein